MSLIRCNERLRNGSRSGVYMYYDGEYFNVIMAKGSIKRRGCDNMFRAKLTVAEMAAIVKSYNAGAGK